MMSQMFAASKDESTLVEFLGRHGVAVEPAGKKKELSDEEIPCVRRAGNHVHRNWMSAGLQ